MMEGNTVKNSARGEGSAASGTLCGEPGTAVAGTG